MDQFHHKDIAPSKLLQKTTHFKGGDAVSHLIYQLVRVEDDGTVIPASEDEMIEMESILGETSTHTPESGPQQMQLKDVEDMLYKQMEDLNSARKFLIGKKEIDDVDAEQKKLLTQLTFLDALLQKLRDEEDGYTGFPEIDITCDSEMVKYYGTGVNNTVSTVTDFDCKSDLSIPTTNNFEDHEQKEILFIDQASGDEEKDNPNDPSNMSMHDQSNISNRQMHENGKEAVIGEYLNSMIKVQKNVNLEKLSVRELHETFQSTFGRPTSVKDKRWLIRRISKAMEGSLETTGINGALDESSVHNTDAGDLQNPVINSFSNYKQKRTASKIGKGANKKRKLDAHKKVIIEKMHLSLLETKFLQHKKRSPRVAHHQFNGNIEHIHRKYLSQSSSEEGKRKRKPTKRYIEELASSEMRGVVTFGAANEKISQSVADKCHKEKHDLAGVTEIKFRKGYRSHRRLKMSGNLFPNSNSSERAAKLVRKAMSVCTSRHSGKSTSNEPKVKIKGVFSEPSKGRERITKPVTKILNVKRIPEVETDDISLKAQNQKKHQHPWTLKEVMKLLEGITHCGVGKWAEIKKLSFSNSVHRSSTDLKDKWRNLVRASNRHLKILSQAEPQRKQSSSHIPGPILMRVYELATASSSHLNVRNSFGDYRNGHK